MTSDNNNNNFNNKTQELPGNRISRMFTKKSRKSELQSKNNNNNNNNAGNIAITVTNVKNSVLHRGYEEIGDEKKAEEHLSVHVENRDGSVSREMSPSIGGGSIGSPLASDAREHMMSTIGDIPTIKDRINIPKTSWTQESLEWEKKLPLLIKTFAKKKSKQVLISVWQKVDKTQTDQVDSDKSLMKLLYGMIVWHVKVCVSLSVLVCVCVCVCLQRQTQCHYSILDIGGHKVVYFCFKVYM